MYNNLRVRNEYVKLTHSTHQNVYEHIAHPPLTTGVIDTLNIILHFHCDYG